MVFRTNASDVTWWPNFQLMQVAPPGPGEAKNLRRTKRVTKRTWRRSGRELETNWEDQGDGRHRQRHNMQNLPIITCFYLCRFCLIKWVNHKNAVPIVIYGSENLKPVFWGLHTILHYSSPISKKKHCHRWNVMSHCSFSLVSLFSLLGLFSLLWLFSLSLKLQKTCEHWDTHYISVT